MQLDFSTIKKVVVLGAGESGVGAAILAKKQGFDVFVSDYGQVAERFSKQLDDYKIAYEAEQHTRTKIMDADLVIKSPGIPETSSMIQELRNKNISIVDEIEFATYFTSAKIIAITGSNGKTTTTRLIYHILECAGYNVGLAGNIGFSFAKQVALTNKDVYVIETSSFQLDNVYTFAPDIALVLNITPDHLDRYEYKMDLYADSKLRITRAQTSQNVFIYNSDDKHIEQAMLRNKPIAKQVPCGINHLSAQMKTLLVPGTNMSFETADLPIKGKHNYFNFSCAVLALDALGVDEAVIKEHIGTFKNEAHRLEPVVTINNVEFINDSKATNVEAAYYALQAMTKPVVWIVGGVDKGNDYSLLFDLVKANVRAIVCLGKDNTKIFEAFNGVHDIIVETTQIGEAIKLSTLYAEPGDVVLLAPACASFDLFANYQDRGNQFKSILIEQAAILDKGAQAQINLNVNLKPGGENHSDNH